MQPGRSTSLLEVRAGGGCDGPTPTTADVVGEYRYVGAVAWRLVSVVCSSCDDRCSPQCLFVT